MSLFFVRLFVALLCLLPLPLTQATSTDTGTDTLTIRTAQHAGLSRKDAASLRGIDADVSLLFAASAGASLGMRNRFHVTSNAIPLALETALAYFEVTRI